jgi:hypothetical protein
VHIRSAVAPCILFFVAAIPLQAQNFVQNWQARVSATQAQQPQWITPVATTSPRLTQEVRFDVLHESIPTGNITNLGNSKGLEIVPTSHIELFINMPPYLLHQSATAKDGWGDFTTTLKYRFISHNNQHGNWVLSAFLEGSIPTGTYKNGSTSAVLTPTVAAGKGWGWLDIQGTLGGTLPVDSVRTIGRTIVSNTVFQAHAAKWLWPEVEINSTFWKGGTDDGKKQTFLTPGLVLGRFPIHGRTAIEAGTGFQIATTHYSTYDHAFIGSIRLPF